MNQARRPSVTNLAGAVSDPPPTLRPDPRAHAEILVLTYGAQTAAWISETNLSTARRSDTPYWSLVLDGVRSLRDQQLSA